jgi:hypothetical protein
MPVNREAAKLLIGYPATLQDGFPGREQVPRKLDAFEPPLVPETSQSKSMACIALTEAMPVLEFNQSDVEQPLKR